MSALPTTAELDELSDYLAQHPIVAVPLLDREIVEKLIAAARELATLKALLVEAKGAELSVGIDLSPITPPGVLP